MLTNRPGTPGTAVGSGRASTPKTSSRLDAGSVEITSVRLPASASATATAQAVVVFPTPPLPVKNR